MVVQYYGLSITWACKKTGISLSSVEEESDASAWINKTGLKLMYLLPHFLIDIQNPLIFGDN